MEDRPRHIFQASHIEWIVLLFLLLYLNGCGAGIEPVRVELTRAVDINAPCTQHVVVAKVTDAKNNPVPRCPVEWILPRSTDAVGAIVEGQPGHKVTNLYARTKTDQHGEARIILTSTQEGRTPFIAFAPDIKDPNTHKVFGVKHWLKAAWAFPFDASTPVGQSRLIEASTYRASCDDPDQAPLPGYRFEFVIQDGPPAYFKDPDTHQPHQRIEIATDYDGIARVRLFQYDDTPGQNKIEIKIKPPDDPVALCCPSGHDVLDVKEMIQTWTASK